jgi:CubicO group peptidase (beta-lactamase class C family)
VGNYFDPEPPSLEKTVASLNGIPLVYEPGTKIKYSNAAIAVVGRVVEVVDGRPFATAVRERVLTPLGMTSSDFEPTAAVKKNLAEGVMWNYHGREFQAPTFELGISPAACMYSNVTELGSLMSTVFAGGKGSKGPMLKAESLVQMLTLQFSMPDAKRGFGLGFFVDELDGHQRVGHSGAMYGFVTVPPDGEARRRCDCQPGHCRLVDASCGECGIAAPHRGEVRQAIGETRWANACLPSDRAQVGRQVRRRAAARVDRGGWQALLPRSEG